MKASEIKVGGKYRAMVSGVLCTVRVDRVRDSVTYRGGKAVDTKLYDVTNERTGRRTTFRSAAKFRSPAADGKAALNASLDRQMKITAPDRREEPAAPTAEDDDPVIEDEIEVTTAIARPLDAAVPVRRTSAVPTTPSVNSLLARQEATPVR